MPNWKSWWCLLLVSSLLARDASASVRNLGQSAVHLSSALAGIDRIVAAVESGDGTLHALIHRDDVSVLFADARQATRDLADVAAQIRTGHGAAHGLV
jgi:hypothetical protein